MLISLKSLLDSSMSWVVVLLSGYLNISLAKSRSGVLSHRSQNLWGVIHLINSAWVLIVGATTGSGEECGLLANLSALLLSLTSEWSVIQQTLTWFLRDASVSALWQSITTHKQSGIDQGSIWPVCIDWNIFAGFGRVGNSVGCICDGYQFRLVHCCVWIVLRWLQHFSIFGESILIIRSLTTLLVDLLDGELAVWSVGSEYVWLWPGRWLSAM